MFLISWRFNVVALALASLIYYYVSIKGKAGDWGDGFKSAYYQLALRSLRSLGVNQVHPKNWYPIPLIFCRPWGKQPENVPCRPKLADFANCMRKKGRGIGQLVGKGLSKNEKTQKLALHHWHEAIDPRHRYGHNLHLYYEVWFDSESTGPFFYWQLGKSHLLS